MNFSDSNSKTIHRGAIEAKLRGTERLGDSSLPSMIVFESTSLQQDTPEGQLPIFAAEVIGNSFEEDRLGVKINEDNAEEELDEEVDSVVWSQEEDVANEEGGIELVKQEESLEEVQAERESISLKQETVGGEVVDSTDDVLGGSSKGYRARELDEEDKEWVVLALSEQEANGEAIEKDELEELEKQSVGWLSDELDGNSDRVPPAGNDAMLGDELPDLEPTIVFGPL
jgi:hypothetical protein